MNRLKRAQQDLFRSENLMPDIQDVLVFGGLGITCYGVAELAGGAVACVVGGATLVWLGVKKP